MRSECVKLKDLGYTKMTCVKCIISLEMILLVRVPWREINPQRQSWLHAQAQDLVEPLSLQASCSHHILAALHPSWIQINPVE